MTYAFMKSLYGTGDLDPVMNSIEYAPHTNPHWDPFSVSIMLISYFLMRLVIICLYSIGSWR
jgi:hypothetical protein